MNPVPTVAGAAPYIGNSATLCNGFGGNSTDLVASGQATQQDEATGTFGATSGSLTEFANGYSFGSLTFNSNDDVGNTTGIANYDCDFQEQGFQRWPDGTTNNQAALYDEFFDGDEPTPTCRDADAGVKIDALCTGSATPYTCCSGVGTGTCDVKDSCTALGTPFACCTGAGTGSCPAGGGAVGADEVNSSVVWGTADQNTFTIVTGVATPVLFGGAYLPPGETGSCTGLQESPIPGGVAVKASPASETDSGPTYPQTKSIALTAVNTSEGACSVGGTLVAGSSNVGVSVTGTSSPVCSLTLSAPGVVSEGDGPQSSAWLANCTCTAAAIKVTACTNSGVPYACCTGLHTGSCTAEVDNYALYAGTGTAPTGSGACPEPPQFSTPIALKCAN